MTRTRWPVSAGPAVQLKCGLEATGAGTDWTARHRSPRSTLADREGRGMRHPGAVRRDGRSEAETPSRLAVTAASPGSRVHDTSSYGCQNKPPAESVDPLDRAGRIILRRKVAVRLPSAARRSLASSQCPYSA